MNFMSIKNWTKETRILLLRALDFDSDGIYVTDKKGEKILDRYSKDPVKIDNMAILPTEKETVILDWNPLSFIQFVEEFGVSLNKVEKNVAVK